MTITRSEIIRMLSDKTGYWQKDIRPLLKAYDELVLDLLGDATVDDPVSIQILQGVKIGNSIIEPRDRVDPRNGEPIHLGYTAKPFIKYSEDFRMELQNQYDNKNLEDSE